MQIDPIKPNHMYLIYLALNNLQRLVCHKPNQAKSFIYLIYMHNKALSLNNLQWSIYHKTQPNQIKYI